MLSDYGTEIGVRAARKHLDWYLAPTRRHVPDGAAARTPDRDDDPPSVFWRMHPRDALRAIRLEAAA